MKQLRSPCLIVWVFSPDCSALDALTHTKTQHSLTGNNEGEKMPLYISVSVVCCCFSCEVKGPMFDPGSRFVQLIITE